MEDVPSILLGFNAGRVGGPAAVPAFRTRANNTIVYTLNKPASATRHDRIYYAPQNTSVLRRETVYNILCRGRRAMPFRKLWHEGGTHGGMRE